MKPQAAVTSSFFPAALAVASISLALLLLPGGGTSARTSGVAPALKLVAGDVVAAVTPPLHVVRQAKPKAIVHHAATVATTPARTQATTFSPPKRVTHSPARRSAPKPEPTSSPRAQSHASTQPPAAPPAVTKHDNGNGHAYGRNKKTQTPGNFGTAPGHAGSAPGHSGAAHGLSGAAHANPHGIPPGLAKKTQAPGNSAPHGHGGGK
jgi:hypothetical protein